MNGSTLSEGLQESETETVPYLIVPIEQGTTNPLTDQGRP
jgi:hypothetical protein